MTTSTRGLPHSGFYQLCDKTSIGQPLQPR